MDGKLFNFINLQNGEEDKEKVLENVKSNISFRGSNLWILACAIVIASVGLNVNSTAVIIGAMLISPLMAPIVGAGFALAIYDFNLLKKSVKNLLIATLVSLAVASIYFFVSPFKEAQSELLARTSPNIYDVLIAFFGGLVGVIAITRVEKGNPIPGVAIATALMPPLCTAGYGLAIGNLSYFFGAFYLYTINCFFICIATFFIIKYLKYKPVQNLNPASEKKIRYGISGIMLIMIIPSFYLAYSLFNERKFEMRVDQFITNEFTNLGYTHIYKKATYNTAPKRIELAFLAKKFTSDELRVLKQKLSQYALQDTELEIIQEVKDLKSEILKEISAQNKNLSETEVKFNNLQKELNLYKIDNQSIYEEMNILFPELKQVTLGRHLMYANTDSATNMVVVLYELEDAKKRIESTKIKTWLKKKLNTNKIALIRHEAED